MKTPQQNRDIVKEFLVESYDYLDQLDQNLVALDSGGDASSLLTSIFRSLHTIKGNSGFFGFANVERLSHLAEDVLSLLRDGQLELTPDLTTAFLKLSDTLRALLQSIEVSGDDTGIGYGEIYQQLVRHRRASSGGSPAVEPARGTGFPSVKRSANEPSDERQGEDCAPPMPAGSGSKVAKSAVRIRVDLLDELMTLVGELVLVRNQLLQLPAVQSNRDLLAASQRLSLITTDLQEEVTRTRLQRVDTTWGKFPRLVRDLAAQNGKQVRIEFHGEETELDRSIIEWISDPLTHLLRNAVDHGIEAPAERERKNKPSEGTIILRAFHESGQVYIEVEDDGAGIDFERIRAKAVTRGFLSAESAGRAEANDLLNFILQPGFSTADRVTSTSGRGVGLDVVKANIEQICGNLVIHSHPGRGTRFTIKIPLTLAIIPALIVTSGGRRYAIPQVNLMELVRVTPEEVRQDMRVVGGSRLYRLRGKLIPLVYLTDVLVRRSAGNTPSAGARTVESVKARMGGASISIFVVQAYSYYYGLVVDEILDTEEIVVKRPGRYLQHLPLFAGATVLSDGTVALILDTLQIPRSANLRPASRHDHRSEPVALGTADLGREPLVLFSAPNHARMAVPLSFVQRIEEVPTSAIDTTGERIYARRRDGLLPLVRITEVFGSEYSSKGASSSVSDAQSVPVLVLRIPGRQIGIIVHEPFDITKSPKTVMPPEAGSGGLRAALVNGEVTRIVDAAQVTTSINRLLETANDSVPERSVEHA